MENRLVKILCLAIVAFCAMTGCVFAAGAQSNIAVVDLRRCIVESAKGKQLKEEFEKKASEFDKKMSSLEKEARGIAGDLEKQGALLSDAVKKEKQQKLMALSDQAKEIDKAKKNLNDELTLKVIKDVQGVIKELADARGYTLVINDGGPWLLYNGPNVDITEEVLSRYDKANGK